MRYNSGVGESFDLEVPPTLAGTRLDVFLSEAMAEPSRTFIQRLIKDDLVSISPGKVKPGYRLKGAEKITLFLPELVEMSGCVSARRFQAVQKEDEFVFMAVYEFVDQASFQKYQESEAKKYLVGDFQEKFGQKAKLKTSVWEQIYP